MDNAEMIKHLQSAKIAKKIIEITEHSDEISLTVAKEDVVNVLTFLRDDKKLQLNQLISICGVDYLPRNDRFEVIYNLLSMRFNLRIRVRVKLKESDFVPSVVSVFSCANWYEREVYDMFGIVFLKHPDLRRILSDYFFEGNPLRKDFPLTGYLEVRYDLTRNRVEHENVQLTQDFRNFDFQSPWSGTEYVLPGDEKATK